MVLITAFIMEQSMLRKMGLSCVAIAIVAFFSNLQAKETAKHPLLGYFKKDGGFSALPILKTSIAKEELNLTDAQIEKIAPLQKEWFGEMTKKHDEKAAELAKKLETILKPEQIDRLLEIMTQMGGPILLSEAEVGKLFELTDEQREKIKAISQEARDSQIKAASSGPRAKNKEDVKTQMKEGFKKQLPILKEANEKIEKILTPKQHDLLDTMQGKKIDTEKLFEHVAETLELPGF